MTPNKFVSRVAWMQYCDPPGSRRLPEETNLNLLYGEKQAYSTQFKIYFLDVLCVL
jgi:hypothetical protein